MLWLCVGPTGVYLFDFFCSGIQFNLLLSPYPYPVPGYPLCLVPHLSFPIGILGQVWYLIVSILDLCTITYFYLLVIS